MTRIMIQAAVTMNQLQNRLDMIGHNLANSETTGYKARTAEFSSLLFQQINHMNRFHDEGERLTPEGIRLGSGAKLGAIQPNMGEGSLQVTNRALDVALLGENYFFQILVQGDVSEEVQYTRDGSFYLSPQAADENQLMLVTKDGHPVLGANGPIELNRNFDQIYINDQGQVIVSIGSSEEVIDQIEVVAIERPMSLEAVGQNLFRVPDVALANADEWIQPIQTELEIVQAGSLESSNVDYIKEMTDLMLMQRAYQMNAQTITLNDQMLGLINQLR